MMVDPYPGGGTEGVNMDPGTIALLIGASAQMLGGLFQSQANQEQQEKQRKYEMLKTGLQTQATAAGNYPASQQNAFNAMMSAYGRALGT